MPSPLCLDVSFQCALGRLQLGAEIHARLSRPHLHLSIDGGATGVGPRPLKPSGPPPGAPPGAAGNEQWSRGGEKSSFSQLGCCSRELRSRRFEEEEGQTGVAFITDAISHVISAFQSRLRGWRCWRGMSSCTPGHWRGKHPRNSFLSPRAMCCEWPPR